MPLHVSVPFLGPYSGGLVDSTLSSYQVEICWYTFVRELCGLWPYVITIRLCVCLVFHTEWNHDKVSLSKEHQTHTRTDCNDIWPQTTQFHDECISIDLNLVTWQRTVHGLPKYGLKNGTKTCRGKFLSVFNVNFSAFWSVYSVCISWNIKEINSV